MIRRLALLSLFILATLGLGGATCSESPLVDPQVEPEDCFLNASGACVLTSPGCDASAITSDGRETCASCEDGEDTLEICGERELAVCFPVEGPNGDCQVCETASGERVFSDCLEGTVAGGDLECTIVDRQQEGGEPIACELCRDASGRLVSETCSTGDACELGELDADGCRECRSDAGDLVRRECAPADVEPPRVCQVYSDEDGRCVDCFGEDDQLILHECVVGAAPADEVCDTFFFGDTRCLRCFDADGGLVSETCEPVDGAFRCERIESPYESCLVCLDETGQEQRSECAPIECVAGDLCATCAPAQDADGTPCRACTIPQDDGTTTTERFCAVGGEITCVNEEIVTGADPAEDPNAPALVETCVVCADQNGVELYRECVDPAPPVCETIEDPLTGELCDRCVTSEGNVEFSSCENAPVGICEDVPELLLTGPEQQPLVIHDTSGDVPAIVDCTTCDTFQLCVTRTECAAGQCDVALAELTRSSTSCDPWGALESAEDIARMMTLLIQETEAAVYSAEHVDQPSSCGVNDCSCETGDIRILVPQAQAPRFVNTFGFGF